MIATIIINSMKKSREPKSNLKKKKETYKAQGIKLWNPKKFKNPEKKEYQ